MSQLSVSGKILHTPYQVILDKGASAEKRLWTGSHVTAPRPHIYGNILWCYSDPLRVNTQAGHGSVSVLISRVVLHRTLYPIPESTPISQKFSHISEPILSHLPPYMCKSGRLLEPSWLLCWAIFLQHPFPAHPQPYSHADGALGLCKVSLWVIHPKKGASEDSMPLLDPEDSHDKLWSLM